MNAATGILFLDIIIRPFMKVGSKFPIVLLIALMAVYAAIAYVALRSAYLADNHT